MAIARTQFVDPGELAAALPRLAGSSTLPQRLHDTLERAIITGALRAGERLHVDDLAAHYGVSRIPIREAMRSLHEAGWVEIRPRHGVRVRTHSLAELDELFEFRAIVEGQVARWAAQRRTATQVVELEATVVASRSGATDELDLLATTSRFYGVLRAASRNEVLAATSEALEKRARFYFSTVAQGLGSEWISAHESVFELVRRGRSGAACEAAVKHVADTGAAVRTLLFPSQTVLA